MTRIVCAVAAAVFSTAAFSQNTSGKITYTETIKMEIRLEGAEAERLKDFLPKERKNQKVLYYTPESSIYTAEKTESQDIQHEQEGMVVKISMGGGEEKVFTDIKNGKRLEQKEFMTRKFIIESEPVAKDWKLTGNQKTILGYPCQEAVRQDSASSTVAWFTPAIPVSAGPAVFSGLPGMVLSVIVDNGKFSMEATSVEPGPVDPSKMEKPKEGKKVSQEEFREIVEEKMKEMQMENGGGGNMIIKMQTH